MKDRIYTWSDALGYYADIHGEMCEADEVVAASDARELMTGLENEIEVLRFAGEVQGERLTAEIALLRGLLRNPPRHRYWKAGDPGCPPEIKADNGELTYLLCKDCGEYQGSTQLNICQARIDAALAGAADQPSSASGEGET